ncbi:MAG: FKBP-type peptidyl-prolyl cis-trans isomerase [Lachnospiraceae bacterium]|nr:FKBP-type peptidyl-prolyl cis-trans isomerase [Lachnospiraceae bacterium]
MSTEISKSKQKRLDQEQNRKYQKAKKAMVTFWSITIPLMLILAIVAGIVVYQRSKLNYSKYLTNDGKIRDVNAADFVSLDYESISFKKADLLPSDETIDNDIAYAISSHATVSEDAALESKSGDRVQISFTATVDGERVAGITEEEGGRTFTIGNEEFTEAYDTALTGRHPGEDFTTEVLFAEDYHDESMAGKNVKIETHVIGIYVDPEFNDEFVTTYYSDKAATAAGYRQSLIDNYYKQNLEQAISDAIEEKVVVNSYPTNYMENMKKVIMAQDKAQMESYNNMYMQYTGSAVYNNVYEMYNYTSEDEYQAHVAEEAQSRTKDALTLQYIYEKAGLSNPESDVRSYFSDLGYDDASFAELQEQYGFGYLAQSVLSIKVLDYLKETINVTE